MFFLNGRMYSFKYKYITTIYHMPHNNQIAVYPLLQMHIVRCAQMQNIFHFLGLRANEYRGGLVV